MQSLKVCKHCIIATIVTNDFSGCLKSITVMAFTSGVKYAGSNLHHNIEIEANGHVGESTLYDLPAEDMKENKGDMWNIDFDSFGIPGCVIPGAIDRVSLIATNADGWNIDSILTIGSMSTGFRVVLTADYDVNRWVDGDSAPENKRFDLQVYHFSGESGTYTVYTLGICSMWF